MGESKRDEMMCGVQWEQGWRRQECHEKKGGTRLMEGSGI